MIKHYCNDIYSPNVQTGISDKDVFFTITHYDIKSIGSLCRNQSKKETVKAALGVLS